MCPFSKKIFPVCFFFCCFFNFSFLLSSPLHSSLLLSSYCVIVTYVWQVVFFSCGCSCSLSPCLKNNNNKNKTNCSCLLHPHPPTHRNIEHLYLHRSHLPPSPLPVASPPPHFNPNLSHSTSSNLTFKFFFYPRLY